MLIHFMDKVGGRVALVPAYIESVMEAGGRFTRITMRSGDAFLVAGNFVKTTEYLEQLRRDGKTF